MPMKLWVIEWVMPGHPGCLAHRVIGDDAQSWSKLGVPFDFTRRLVGASFAPGASVARLARERPQRQPHIAGGGAKSPGSGRPSTDRRRSARSRQASFPIDCAWKISELTWRAERNILKLLSKLQLYSPSFGGIIAPPFR